MKKLYTLLFFIAVLIINSVSSTTIIFLQGTACAGKTSICREVQSLDNTWKIVDEDAIFYEQAPIRWSKLFPQEFSTIVKAVESYNILHAIMRNQILFKDLASQ